MELGAASHPSKRVEEQTEQAKVLQSEIAELVQEANETNKTYWATLVA